MAIFAPITRVLSDKQIFTIALGTMVSALVLNFVKGFADDMIMPTIKPAIESLSQEADLENIKIHLGPFHFHVGSFIKKLVEFLVMIMVIGYLSMGM
jgi:large-conductance mechanosensitive channel